MNRWRSARKHTFRSAETAEAWKFPVRKLPSCGNFRVAETSEARSLPKRGDCRSAETAEARSLPKRGDFRSAETAEARRLQSSGESAVRRPILGEAEGMG